VVIEGPQLFYAAMLVLFSMSGACVKWLRRLDKGPTPKFVSLVSEAASAAFSGVLLYFVYAWQEWNPYLTLCAAGLLGNQGSNGIGVITRMVSARSGVDLQAVNDSDADRR